ncbi:MAG: TIGR04076 family protein, partial [Chloroflexota bacterium]
RYGMAEGYRIRLTVSSVKGTCDAGHKVGDSWVLESKTPAGVCMSAFSTLYPYIRALRFGAEFPWCEDKDVAYIACPDPQNPVVFEVRRLRQP